MTGSNTKQMGSGKAIVNVGSVIVGVTVFLTATAWIHFIRDLTDEVYLNYHLHWRDRYMRTWRSLLIAIIHVIILALVIIVIYAWYQRQHAIIDCN